MVCRVLLASMNVGGGHRALRDSLARALTSEPSSGLQPILFDSADRQVERFYRFCVRHLPALQGRFFELSDLRVSAALAARLLPSLVAEARRLLQAGGHELVVSTHPVLTLALARARGQLGCAVPLVSAIPDYGPPTAFFLPEDPRLRADGLVVMEEDTKGRALRMGLSPERVHLSGFLPHEAFATLGAWRRLNGRDPQARARLAQRLAATLPPLRRLDPARPTALFLGGSGWAAKTAPVLERLLRRRGPLNLVVVCGTDRAFEASLGRRSARHPELLPLGFLSPDQLASVMALSDVPILGSLAPATLQALLEVGLGPLLVFRVIPGTEAPHAGFVEKERIGLYAPVVERTLELVEEALGLRVPSARLRAVSEGFTDRACEIRERNVRRAEGLAGFLRAIAAGEGRTKLRIVAA